MLIKSSIKTTSAGYVYCSTIFGTHCTQSRYWIVIFGKDAIRSVFWLLSFLCGMVCWGPFHETVLYRGADKSLARPGRKQATFLTFYGTWRFITTFTTVHHLSLPWPSQSILLPITLLTGAACFIPGRAKDLPAPRFIDSFWKCVWITVISAASCRRLRSSQMCCYIHRTCCTYLPWNFVV